jgi:hypothetical protein
MSGGMRFDAAQKEHIDRLIEGRLLREKRRQDGERSRHIAESAELHAEIDRRRAELAVVRAALDQHERADHQRFVARLARGWHRISNIWGE